MLSNMEEMVSVNVFLVLRMIIDVSVGQQLGYKYFSLRKQYCK